MTLIEVPAAREILTAAFAEENSPTRPAFALLFVVVPTMPDVLDGVIALLAVIVVKEPVDAVVDPMAPGAANVPPTNVAALIDVLHAKPALAVQFSALDDNTAQAHQVIAVRKQGDFASCANRDQRLAQGA